VSYALARAQIVTIVEGVTSTRAELGLGPFKHFPDLGLEETPPPRGFVVLHSGGSADGAMTYGRQYLFRDVDLVVFYAEATRVALLDEIIADDMDAIREALLDESLWGRPTSTLEEVTAGGPFHLPYDVQRGEGAVVVTMRIPLRHR
jgi:hypothetical protein